MTRHRLNRGGGRQANHALWRIVITRMGSHPPTRAYVARRAKEGLSKPEIIRCARRISDAIYAALVADARRDAAACPQGPGGQPGNRSVSRAAGSHPARRLFGQATPGPATTLRPSTTEALAPGQLNGAVRHRAKNSLADLKKPATTT